MEWYVYYHDFNARKIIQWNIFKHGTFKAEVENLLKEKLTRTEFDALLERKLMYYFWAKCEYEVVLTPWVDNADGVKIDVYEQVMMNFNRFVDYLWQQKHKDDCQWILCSERLPEYIEDQYVEYLVSTDNERIYKMPYDYADEGDEEPCFHEWDDEM